MAGNNALLGCYLITEFIITRLIGKKFKSQAALRFGITSDYR
jgi:hypothetical protein